VTDLPARQGRLPWPRPDELTDPQRRVYEIIWGGQRAADSDRYSVADEEGRLEGPFNLMLSSPALGGPLQALGRAVRFESALTDRQREIAILCSAAWTRSDFEWYAHARLGKRAGLSDEELAAIQRGDGGPSLDPNELMVHRLTQLLLATGDLDDLTFASAVDALGMATVVDLTLLVGYYHLLAFTMRVFRTPLPRAEQPIRWP
jgi:alkylhydroperoxidase/carboxymuconolactone decarboxylase family protein YurZ